MQDCNLVSCKRPGCNPADGCQTQWLKDQARQLVESAALRGLVLTVEQRPLRPLAMGNYETVVTVRPARNPA